MNIKLLIKRTLILGFVLGNLLAIPSTFAQGVVAVSNLSEPATSNTGVGDGLKKAFSFTTGPVPASLSGITVQFTWFTVDRPGVLNAFTLDLYSDLDGTPNAWIQSFVVDHRPPAQQDTFFSIPTTPLLPNTTYWVVAALGDNHGDFWSPYFDTTDSDNESRLGGWSTGNDHYLQRFPSLDWQFVNDQTPLFSVQIIPKPPTISCSEPLTLECENGAALGTVQAGVTDADGLPLEVVWSVDGIPYQTNDIPAGGAITTSNLTFTAEFLSGVHVVAVSASDGQTEPATCSTTVTVRDTTPPRITRIVATPSLIWPPNKRMVPVSVAVDANDNCDSLPVVRITKITSNEPKSPFATDWEITGPQSVNLRADRLGKGTGRVYTIAIECKDATGNVSFGSVNVVVPHDAK